MLFTFSILLHFLAASAVAAPDLVKSFDGAFRMFIQFTGTKFAPYHLANTLPGQANQGLIIGLNGSGNPGNLAQQFVFKDGQLQTSYGAVTYGNRTTDPADTGYPIAPLSRLKDTNEDFYLQFIPTAAPETGLAFKKTGKRGLIYQLVYANGSDIALSFAHNVLDGRYSGVIFGPEEPPYSKAIKLFTYGPDSS